MRRTHGHTSGSRGAASRHTPEYRAWYHMKERCAGAIPRPERYAGRGIVVCAGFRSDFNCFLVAVGPRPTSQHSIDRADNSGHYSCGECEECRANKWSLNCRWATRREQQNNRDNTVWLIHNAEIVALADLARRHGLNSKQLRSRLDLGWSIARALSEPITPSSVRHRGSSHPMAKLSDADRAEICRLYVPTQHGIMGDLARRFGVNQQTIRHVVVAAGLPRCRKIAPRPLQ